MQEPQWHPELGRLEDHALMEEAGDLADARMRIVSDTMDPHVEDEAEDSAKADMAVLAGISLAEVSRSNTTKRSAMPLR